MIRFWWPWPYVQGHYTINIKKKNSLFKAVNSLFAHYSLTNRWNSNKLAQIDTSSGWRKEVIKFWWPWPYFQGLHIINTQKVSFVNAVKGLCAHYPFNHLLVLIDFGDLDFSFKVMPALWNLNFVRKRLYAGLSNKGCLLTIFICYIN